MRKNKQYDLILTEYIGREGAQRLRETAPEQCARLCFRETYERNPDRRTPEEKAAAIEGVLDASDAPYYQAVLEGGIFCALWNLSQECRCGLDVEIVDIPIRQETIEICECTGSNPYYLKSGAEVILAAVPASRCVLSQLKEQGIHAAVIGNSTSRKACILHQAGNIRYLDRPDNTSLHYEEM